MDSVELTQKGLLMNTAVSVHMLQMWTVDDLSRDRLLLGAQFCMYSLSFACASLYDGVHIFNVALMNVVIISGVCGDSIFQYSETCDDRLLPESSTDTC
jgi:hypothetical protein